MKGPASGGGRWQAPAGLYREPRADRYAREGVGGQRREKDKEGKNDAGGTFSERPEGLAPTPWGGGLVKKMRARRSQGGKANFPQKGKSSHVHLTKTKN